MRRDSSSIWANIDWTLLFIFLGLATIGVLNIYAAIYNPELDQILFDPSWKSGKQFVFLCISLLLGGLILLVDFKVYFSIPYLFYGFAVFLLLLVFTPLGHEVAGNKSWLKLGGFTLQPSEFAKVGVALVYAKLADNPSFKYEWNENLLKLGGFIFLPMALILAQPDTGSALVFTSMFIVMYLDGLNPLVPALGLAAVILFVLTLIWGPIAISIGFGVIALVVIFFLRKNKQYLFGAVGGLLLILAVTFGTDFFFNSVLKDHQKERITVLLGALDDIEDEITVLKTQREKTENPDRKKELRSEIRAKSKKLRTLRQGPAWNMEQAKIAIGSGGLTGKGFREGIITKSDFVPEQHTDFIFCTIGEEHGFFGSIVVISMYLFLLMRIMYIAQRQNHVSRECMRYSVLSIFFFHFLVNIGMAIGLFPVIGIPLPFFSYGGSSLLAYTIMLFILIKLDAHRNQMLARI